MAKDFKQDPSPLDDQGPMPMPPMPELPTIEEDLAADETEDDKLAQAYWSPAWGPVQEKLQAILDTYGDPANAVVYKDLPAEEFKVRMLSEAAVRTEITKIMEDVKRAVESIESRPKPAERAKEEV